MPSATKSVTHQANHSLAAGFISPKSLVEVLCLSLMSSNNRTVFGSFKSTPKGHFWRRISEVQVVMHSCPPFWSHQQSFSFSFSIPLFVVLDIVYPRLYLFALSQFRLLRQICSCSLYLWLVLGHCRLHLYRTYRRRYSCLLIFVLWSVCLSLAAVSLHPSCLDCCTTLSVDPIGSR